MTEAEGCLQEVAEEGVPEMEEQNQGAWEGLVACWMSHKGFGEGEGVAEGVEFGETSGFWIHMSTLQVCVIFSAKIRSHLILLAQNL